MPANGRWDLIRRLKVNTTYAMDESGRGSEGELQLKSTCRDVIKFKVKAFSSQPIVLIQTEVTRPYLLVLCNALVITNIRQHHWLSMQHNAVPHDVAGHRPATSWVHYTTSCNIQSSAPEDGQNNFPKHVELTGIIHKPLLLYLVGCLYYLYQ